jgi:hypothetical protein
MHVVSDQTHLAEQNMRVAGHHTRVANKKMRVTSRHTHLEFCRMQPEFWWLRSEKPG